MISIKNLKSGGGGGKAVANYCEHRRADEAGYYSGDGAPSAWHGRGAEALDLRGPVQRDDLVRVLEGKLPNGTDLSQRGNRDDRRLGVDLTFSAPKSVSIAALAAGDDRLLAAHDRAVRAALDYLEREVIMARRGHSGAESEATGSMVAALYRHEDARPVNGHADPQLHTHAIEINATQRPDGEWSAMDLQFGAGSVRMHLADAIYKSELAIEAHKLGYDIRPTHDGFELKHISDAQIAQFSLRREQIDAALADRGLTRETANAAERSAANMQTREGKRQTSHDEQRWEWRREARERGIDATLPAPRAGAVKDLSAEAVRSAVRHLSERETVFSRDEIRLEALRAGVGHVCLPLVDRQIEAGAGGLIPVGGHRYTTREGLYREQEVLARVSAGRGQATPIMSDAEAAAFVTAREMAQGFRYTAGQRAALTLGLTSHDRAVAIEGAAGAGKTTSMRAMVEAARARGLEVIGIAPSARARNELESAGAAVNRTVASFLAREHVPNPDRLVILDEAGMVSARDMDLFLRKLDTEGGRVVLVGDTRQLRAVEAGTPFTQMLETGAVARAAIDEIQRQVDPRLREIAQRFARGDARGATQKAMAYATVAPITARDPAKPSGSERQAGIAKAAAEAYLALSAEERARTLVVSGTNAVRQQINEQVRRGLQEQGVVSRDGIPIQALSKAQLTREKAALAESYTPGLVVRLDEGGGRTRQQIDYTVSRVEAGRVVLQRPDGGERRWDPARVPPGGVYVPRDLNLAAGDLVMFRENSGGGNERVTNGQTAIIERAGSDGITARLYDGREITLDPRKSHSIDYSWARTVHSAQGATVDHVIVAGEASRLATAESAYVSCSRERETLKIITDDPGRLQKSWEQWADKQHAICAARSTEAPDVARLQELRRTAGAELGKHGDLSRAREESRTRDASDAPGKAPARSGHDRDDGLELGR